MVLEEGLQGDGEEGSWVGGLLGGRAVGKTASACAEWHTACSMSQLRVLA